MEFNIGDKVKIISWEDVPEERKVERFAEDPTVWNRGKANVCGQVGTVVDKMFSEAVKKTVYRVHFEGKKNTCYSFFDDESMEAVIHPSEPCGYGYTVDRDGQYVIAKLYEVDESGNRIQLVGVGRGKIFYDDLIGFAQASSYALKKIYETLNGGCVGGRQ